MWLIGDSNITVGDNTTISCFTDFSIQRLEWVYNDEVIASSVGQQTDLVFNQVQEYFHNRQYTCRAVTSYGVMELEITTTVHSKCNSLTVSTTLDKISYD